MEIQQLYTGLSSRIIRQFTVVFSALIVLVLFNIDVFQAIYLDNQQTVIGILINGGIVVLFVFGLANILFHLLRYQREEAAVAGFAGNVESRVTNPINDLPANSLIVARYATMRAIQGVNGQIDHVALASMLSADEKTRFGLIRFISNILILTGVFGTIVSLSIAMLGVSGLIESSSGGIGGIRLVIHGMSTALSTTITAIISYVFFQYFFIRLVDVHTRLLGIVEYLTLVYLLPLTTRSADNIAEQIDGQIVSLDTAMLNLTMTEEVYQGSVKNLQQAFVSNRQPLEGLEAELGATRKILSRGFRLSTDEH
jgi:hypothetical protein